MTACTVPTILHGLMKCQSLGTTAHVMVENVPAFLCHTIQDTSEHTCLHWVHFKDEKSKKKKKKAGGGDTLQLQAEPAYAICLICVIF